ncbi:pentapeptide repeat-containing protein [Rhodococcus opacus]|uniref:pentapeptide repeat-containing protein n=1 Tax=Rhodococcus opacus TaxID=37919 RepID=UPI001F5915EF|nr:pentapeptide repeat-containing protein [Rhodococcus opacus]UNN02047.1 pentapeptide repeat-containing protein [Rhodococcus opacus]
MSTAKPRRPRLAGDRMKAQPPRRARAWAAFSRMMTSPVFWQAVVGLATAVAAITAVVISSRNLSASTDQFELQQRQQQQQQASDRFARAMDQLSSDRLETRLGAIYSLEEVARDFPAQHPAVFEVITAYVRTHTPASVACAGPTPPAADAQAAVTVIGRRDIGRDGPTRIDLSHSCLAGAHLSHAHLSHAHLSHADLSGTDLLAADLVGGDLRCATLTGADLRGTDLSNKILYDVVLTGADLRGTDLSGVANLIGANLTGVVHDETTIWPDGVTPPPALPIDSPSRSRPCA